MVKKVLWVPLLVTLVSLMILFQGVTAGQVLADQGLPGSDNDPLVSKGYADQYIKDSFVPLTDQATKVEKQISDLEAKATTLAGKLVPYIDIRDHWAQGDITFLYNRKIITGFEDGTFHPTERVTRVQLAVMLVRAKGLSLGGTGKDFKDIPVDFWANKEITAAKKAGIISGYSDGTFKPAQPVSRQEIATMIARAFKFDSGVSSSFEDTNNSWAKEDIAKLAGVGVIGGYEDKTFRPTRTATRAEISAILARAIDPSRRITTSTGRNLAGN